MSQAVSRDEYRRRWESHLEQFERLKLHLNDGQQEILEDTLDQLGELCDVAAEQRDGGDHGDR